ncbi:MAG: hypothetical protein GEV03_23820 [Streptosporangiales bacterium]|nr:hypothetical protein [Streptosporangiales bacterium]
MEVLEHLDRRTCLNQLTETVVGRVAFVEDGRPAVELVTHFVWDDVVIILERSDTALSGAIRNRTPIAFEADRIDSTSGTGWYVTVTGRADRVIDTRELTWCGAVARSAGLKPDAQYIKITESRVAGARIHSHVPARRAGPNQPRRPGPRTG